MNTDLAAQIESLLFYDNEPWTIKELADICDTEPESIQRAITSLQDDLEDRGLTIVQSNGAYQLRTDQRLSDLIKQAHKQSVNDNLTTAQSEALAVIAYLAPVTKPIIDFIRGVNSRSVLRNLLTRGLIVKDVTDGDTHYTLANKTLAHLGIDNVAELPQFEDTRQKLLSFVETHQDNEHDANH